MLRSRSRSRFLPLASALFCAALSIAAPDAFAQASPAQKQSLGPAVRPTYEYQPTTIAVVPFSVTNSTVEMETFPSIIRRDLELSGFFKMVADQTSANRQNREDGRGGINFNAWKSLGAENYLMGQVTEKDGNYSVRILLYDINNKRNVFDRIVTDRKERVRDLAHQISDLTIKYLKGVDGIFRTKLLFTTEQVPGVKEIAIMDADGFNAHTITNYGKLATMAVWGANGTECYFTSYHGNRAKMYGMLLRLDPTYSIIGGQTWVIAPYGGTNHSPTWSQGAGRLGMVLSKDGNSEIYSASRDGSGLARLTKTSFTEGSPTWSPDGRQIAFTSNEAGGVQLFVMNADGSNRRRLTRFGSWNDSPAFSPDGTRIAFVGRQGGVNDIYTVNTSGDQSSLRRLTMGQGNCDNPSWAPDGVHLCFTSNRSGPWHIYMMLDDGSNQRQLTTQGKNTLPDWGPLPAQK